MSNTSLGLLAAAALCLVATSSASADCRITKFRFYVDQNDSVAANAYMDGTGCTMRYGAGGKLVLSSASVAAKPANGTLTQSGPLAFRYRPQPGFKGSDRYALKVCGSNSGGSGCSTITYTAIVE